ncbi:SSI family serine proteinase inhibitor [Streptomyces sp. NPDC086787]|uniref:SSI family serine proteinase inhibitor n=1 Tax=Streptomyces sp. NPDC086787 TaxID=3365759 RepID=UPI0038293557
MIKAYSTVLLAATALAAAGPAVAAGPAPSGADSGTWLQLTVTRGDTLSLPLDPARTPTVPSGGTRGRLLLCDPPKGHPRAAGACADLAAADGDIGRIPPKEDAVCTMIYAPVTARAYGQWHGRIVTYEKTFSNACTMAARTGALFALDD